MSHRQGDTTSLGAILVSMGAISPSQLDEAVEAQERSSLDMLIGNQLVVMQMCELSQVEDALAKQARMRKNGHAKALAVADIAQERMRRAGKRLEEVVERSARVARSATGQDHPAITSTMLAEGEV